MLFYEFPISLLLSTHSHIPNDLLSGCVTPYYEFFQANFKEKCEFFQANFLPKCEFFQANLYKNSNSFVLVKKVDTDSYFPLSPFSEVDNAERTSPFSLTEVDSLSRTNFGVGSRALEANVSLFSIRPRMKSR